jgi:hypothetical protein
LRDGAVVDRGHGANVLDGPLSALRHLVDLLARDPVNSPLATGDIVTHRHLDARFSDLVRRELEYDASRHRSRRQLCLVHMNRESRQFPQHLNRQTHSDRMSGVLECHERPIASQQMAPLLEDLVSDGEERIRNV